jgi:hypothetical protein
MVLTGHPQHQGVSSIRAPAVKKPMDVVKQKIRFGQQSPLAATCPIPSLPHGRGSETEYGYRAALLADGVFT